MFKLWRSKTRAAVTDTSSIGDGVAYAIGDIHGRIDLLNRLLELIRADIATRSVSLRTLLIFLGDYVDRGSFSVEVAITIHYYEAILACLAIVVWHFYHVMFDPDVYPMNGAWLDGKVPRKWLEEEHPLALRRSDGEIDGLSHRCCPVVERGIRDRKSVEPRDQRLELEDGLQDALGHFGLIGRIGRHELATPSQRPHHRWDLVVIGPGASEAHQSTGRPTVGCCQPFHLSGHVRL